MAILCEEVRKVKLRLQDKLQGDGAVFSGKIDGEHAHSRLRLPVVAGRETPVRRLRPVTQSSGGSELLKEQSTDRTWQLSIDHR